MLLKGEILGSSNVKCTNNLIMESVRAHNGGVEGLGSVPCRAVNLESTGRVVPTGRVVTLMLKQASTATSKLRSKK
ncbi:hypothetical protein F2Q69_00029749 [Brassica cretica]|uniref:Uncharacterized protein n=1 Tax=Brassica cretica TaxID=69181 RepID=A0A8S9S811_BRACR|nr:hypothetical protein F2Q69_00029749 [Brassica cretica]